MRKLVFSCVAATLLAATPAAAEPCIGQLFGESYETEGQCTAALMRKRNEMRQYYQMRGDSGAFNEIIDMYFVCVEAEDGLWRVDLR